ncbi:MAG: FtsX-like permease family protein [bacterium]|nr:FtsX-like permease family protein [bacterium]
MVKYIKIALRNIRRHKRRTILIVIMITTAVAVTIFLEGILEDMRQGWLKAIIHTQTGHIQIMHKGYLEKELMAPLDMLISHPKKIEKFLEKQESILAMTKRLNFGGMIATPEKTAIFSGIAVDPVNEYEVFCLLDVDKGEKLSPYKENGCVIGVGLAKNLAIEVGDVVTLISNTIEGTLNAVDVEIVGIFKSGQPQVDNMLLYVTFPTAYNLLNIVGDKVSNIILVLKSINLAPKFASILRSFIKDRYIGEELDVHLWSDLATLYRKVMGMNKFTTSIIELIMFFLITLGICNTMLMAVFERTKEIGTMTAFGIRKGEIVGLFLCESLIIGIFGGLLGSILGAGITQVIQFIGIPFVPPGTDKLVYIRPIVCLDKIVLAFILATITPIIGGLYPAFWASKIKPVEALRFV